MGECIIYHLLGYSGLQVNEISLIQHGILLFNSTCKLHVGSIFDQLLEFQGKKAIMRLSL